MQSAKLRLCIFAAAVGFALFMCASADHQVHASTTAQPIPAVADSAPASDIGPTTPVRRGDLTLSLNFDGVFVPLDPMQVRVTTRRYHDDFLIKTAVAPGTTVSKGDVLLELETAKIDQQIAAAQNELKIAQANLTKAQADLSLGEHGDALATTNVQQALANAQTTLKRWDGPDGATFLLASRVNVRAAQLAEGNAADELSELHKMYKSEDITNQTADIVMKRAAGSLEMQKLFVRIQTGTDEKVSQFDAVVKRQELVAEVAQQQVAMDQLNASQAQSQVLRQTSLVTARAALDEAANKLDELKKDRQNFSIVSTIDGVAVYGSFDNKSWQQTDPSRLAPGEKVEAGKTVITVFAPGKLALQAECPESQITFFTPGVKVNVVPTALTDMIYQGTCQRIPFVSEQKGPRRIFNILVDLPAVDGRLAPGFGADVNLDAGSLQNVLMIPSSAVSHGKVWVTNPSSPQPQVRSVVAGRSNGQQTEIKSGLDVGDLVLTQPKIPSGQQN